MGIPYYFYILTKQYENILLSTINFTPDIIYFDFNGIIHPISSKNNNSNITIFENLWTFINQTITNFNPRELFICIDGIAPLAKIIQQRKRRYLSNYKKYIEDLKISLDDIELNKKSIDEISKTLIACFKNGNKLLVCGNGGSCSDASHFVGELTCTFKNRNKKELKKQTMLLGLGGVQSVAKQHSGGK